MDKRHFLAAAALSPALSQAAPAAARGPALLTISGAIGRSNRGALDPVLDQLMHKQGQSFSKALALDWQTIGALPARTIRPTLEYDGKVRALRGPLLTDVLALAQAPVDAKLVLRALDGYAVQTTMAQCRAQAVLAVTHLDGQALALGGFGPLWAMVDADRLPALAALALKERYSQCPWGLYHIDVQA